MPTLFMSLVYFACPTSLSFGYVVGDEDDDDVDGADEEDEDGNAHEWTTMLIMKL